MRRARLHGAVGAARDPYAPSSSVGPRLAIRPPCGALPLVALFRSIPDDAQRVHSERLTVLAQSNRDYLDVPRGSRSITP